MPHVKSEARWVRAGVPAVVLLVAAVIRLWGLPSPNELYWDEQYYVYDAEAYLGGGIGQPIPGAPAVKIADEGTWVHPPLGKWIMALLGVGPVGLRPIGWRLPSAVFGIAGVALLYLLALRLWRSVWWAGFASLLLALDGLHIVQSRIAMLDIFLTTFVTAGMLFLALDRERMDEGPSGRWPRIEGVFGSPYRLWAGVFLGAAVATKWSGAFALALATVLCAVWLFTGGRPGVSAEGSKRRHARGLVRPRAARRLPPELRRVLLPARPGPAGLRDAPGADAATTSSITPTSSPRTPCRGPGRSCCIRSSTSAR